MVFLCPAGCCKGAGTWAGPLEISFTCYLSRANGNAGCPRAPIPLLTLTPPPTPSPSARALGGKGAVALGKTSAQDGQALTAWARTVPCSSSSREEVHGGGRALRAGRGAGTHLCTCPDGWMSGGREQLPVPPGPPVGGYIQRRAAVPTPGS